MNCSKVDTLESSDKNILNDHTLYFKSKKDDKVIPLPKKKIELGLYPHFDDPNFNDDIHQQMLLKLHSKKLALTESLYQNYLG